MIDILLKYILWHDFLNDLDARRDFDKDIVTKQLVKYALLGEYTNKDKQ